MKYGIIDIGSNSVRLLISEGFVSVKKFVITTQLDRGLALTGYMQENRIQKTIQAIEYFKQLATELGCSKCYCFATEAVRSAKNSDDFLNLATQHSIKIDVVSSQMEAKLGFIGAYTSGVCCVLDIGGASTEISVGDCDNIYYCKSLPIGLVRIKDMCGEDFQKINKYVRDTIKDFREIPKFDFLLGIGGAQTCFSAILNELEIYDPTIVNNSTINIDDIIQATNHIASLSLEDRKLVKGLDDKRRDVIVGGGILLSCIMQHLGCDNLQVRECDNLEGYLRYKLDSNCKLLNKD